jgi:hypothetical protein
MENIAAAAKKKERVGHILVAVQAFPRWIVGTARRGNDGGSRYRGDEDCGDDRMEAKARWRAVGREEERVVQRVPQLELASPASTMETLRRDVFAL